MAKKATQNAVSGAAKKDTQRELFAKELRSLIPQLDSEGLAFLIEQGRVHLYNMQVEELNRAALAADKTAKAGISGSRGKPKSAGKQFRVEGTASGSSYYLYYGNSDIMFSRDEMLRLAKIAGSKGTDLEIRERLYNWFNRERRDVFSVIPMADKFDIHLKEFAAYIKKSIKIRGDKN